MADPITPLSSEAIRAHIARVRDAAGPHVEILVATKYVLEEDMGALVDAGVELVGENRLQDLEAKRARWGDRFRWDFIGALQSRKVPKIAGLVDRIHSVASWSALAKLERLEGPAPEIFLQVNVAGEESKAGFAPDELADAVARSPVRPSGLTTMPPAAEVPEESRPHFARLAELAAENGLTGLSMGTSQDWPVAVQEGATVIRLGSSALR